MSFFFSSLGFHIQNDSIFLETKKNVMLLISPSFPPEKAVLPETHDKPK